MTVLNLSVASAAWKTQMQAVRSHGLPSQQHSESGEGYRVYGVDAMPYDVVGISANICLVGRDGWGYVTERVPGTLTFVLRARHPDHGEREFTGRAGEVYRAAYDAGLLGFRVWDQWLSQAS